MAAGKVCTGFSKPYVAKYSASGGTISFTQGRKLARGVSVNIAPNSSDDNKFYADNVEAESAAGIFTGGTLTLTVDGLFREAEQFIMGLPEEGADHFVAYGDNQDVPNVAVGFITRYMSDGVTTFVPTVIIKTKFNQISSQAQTQGDEIDWQTQELTASIMRAEDVNHSWKYIGKDYSTEDAAEAALKAKLNIPYSVTQTLTKITSSFTGDTVNNGAAFTATLTPDTGYELDSVEVLMGGTDITSTAYNNGVVNIASVTGDVAITAVGVAIPTYAVTQTLTNVTSSFTDDTVEEGAAFTATLTPDAGYTISTVEVLMGETDITSTAYEAGVVTIASVTAAITITATATEG